MSDDKTRQEKLEKELAEVTEKWKRAVADYHNLEKRVEKERSTITEFSNQLLLTSFLPIVDSLEEAAKNSQDSGYALILKQFKDTLEQEGVSEIKAKGETFDPGLHEALEMVEGEEDNVVVEVARSGYKMGERVLRPARVVVSRKESNN